MKRRIEFEIRRLILEIVLVIVCVIISGIVWSSNDFSSTAEIASHYSKLSNSSIVITNKRKYIYSESYEEAIREMNVAYITSYEDNNENHDIYLLLPLNSNYDDLYFSNGSKICKLNDIYSKTDDYIYFKIDNKEIGSKQTISYNYYIWSKDLQKDKNIKIKFAVL